jgi:hypothetical protein
MGRGSQHRYHVKLTDLAPAALAQLQETEVNRTDRRHKQGRIKVSKAEERTVDGIVFASKLEAKFYTNLKAVIPKGELHLQPEFLLQEKFKDIEGKAIRSISYKADFLLGPPRTDPAAPLHPDNVVIDAKGHLTDVFRLKAKMFMYHYPVKLYTVTSVKALLEVVNEYLEKQRA